MEEKEIEGYVEYIWNARHDFEQEEEYIDERDDYAEAKYADIEENETDAYVWGY